MPATTEQPQTAPVVESWPVIRFRVPPSWHAALVSAAEVQGLTVSSLLRLLLGPFVRERLQ